MVWFGPTSSIFDVTTFLISFSLIAPYTKLGDLLGLAPLPMSAWWMLIITVIAYLALVQMVKNFYVKRYGELL